MKKTLITILATVLVCCFAVGGTLAWLIDSTDSVENTFTVGKVDIELTETTGSEYKMIPGTTHAKDPTVTVKGGSEKCYLFVKVVATDNGSNLIEYTVDSNWQELTGVTNVYYQEVDASDADQAFAVLKNNQVKISETNVTSETTVTPKLAITAYAVQFENMADAKDAWTKAGFN